MNITAEARQRTKNKEQRTKTNERLLRCTRWTYEGQHTLCTKSSSWECPSQASPMRKQSPSLLDTIPVLSDEMQLDRMLRQACCLRGAHRSAGANGGAGLLTGLLRRARWTNEHQHMQRTGSF